MGKDPTALVQIQGEILLLCGVMFQQTIVIIAVSAKLINQNRCYTTPHQYLKNKPEKPSIYLCRLTNLVSLTRKKLFCHSSVMCLVINYCACSELLAYFFRVRHLMCLKWYLFD